MSKSLPAIRREAAQGVDATTDATITNKRNHSPRTLVVNRII